jgi:hypothetical protein
MFVYKNQLKVVRTCIIEKVIIWCIDIKSKIIVAKYIERMCPLNYLSHCGDVCSEHHHNSIMDLGRILCGKNPVTSATPAILMLQWRVEL